MDVIGEGKIIFTDPQDELPHQPLDDPNWQESAVVYFWDREQSCYGFLRIGHEPNQGSDGLAVIWCNLWVPEFQYKYTDSIPLQASDRSDNSMGSGDRIRYHYDGGHHWSVSDEEISARLTMLDSHQAFDFFAGQNLGSIAPNHIEASGIVNGEIIFRGKTYRIENAIAHRDRSWGIRVWESLRTHRWTPAIFADGFSVNAMSYIGQGGSLSQFGFVIRDDQLIVPTDVSICCHLEADGQTSRGGNVRFTLASGEVLQLDYSPLVPSALSFYRGYPCNDALCEVTCEGSRGVGVFESGGNSMGGREAPVHQNLVNGNMDNGIFPYLMRASSRTC